MLDTTQKDRDLAFDVIRRLIGDEADPDRLLVQIIEGEPISKGRHRFTRKGLPYTPKKTAIAQESLAWRLKESLGDDGGFPGCVAIAAVFFRPNYQRIDADNLMKLVLDAGTRAGVWIDDCYVTAQSSYLELDRQRPRTIIAICPTKSTLDRTARFTCQHCQKPFWRGGSEVARKPPKMCSYACVSAAAAKRRGTLVCLGCGKTVTPAPKGNRKFCSPACSVPYTTALAHDGNRQKWARMQKPVCSKCGGPVSRWTHSMCRGCAGPGRRLGSKNRPKASTPLLS